MSKDGDISAVVVNHNCGDLLITCVDSLRKSGIDEVIVVDNASSDGSFERLADHDRGTTLVPTGKNLGYGTAANRGVERSNSEFVLICNPDVVLDETATSELIGALITTPDVGIVGPRVIEPSGAIYPSARAFPAFGDAIGHALIGLFQPNNRFTRRYRLESSEGTGARDVDWVSGACVLVRRVAFESIEGFDERYFMYVEDLDLCWRLKRAGWRVRHVPTAQVMHVQGVSSAHHPYRMILAHHCSTWRFVNKSTTGTKRAMLPVIAVGLGARLAVAIAREAQKQRRQLVSDGPIG